MGSTPLSSLPPLPAAASGRESPPPNSEPQSLLAGADPPAERSFEETDETGSPLPSDGSGMRFGAAVVFRVDVAPFFTLRGRVIPVLLDGIMGLAIITWTIRRDHVQAADVV